MVDLPRSKSVLYSELHQSFSHEIQPVVKRDI